MSDALVRENAAKMAGAAQNTYQSPDERSAMRGALGDAAGLCDAIARYIIEEGRGRNGRVRKEVVAASKIAKRCGDEIWEMRSLIKVRP